MDVEKNLTVVSGQWSVVSGCSEQGRKRWGVEWFLAPKGTSRERSGVVGERSMHASFVRLAG